MILPGGYVYTVCHVSRYIGLSISWRRNARVIHCAQAMLDEYVIWEYSSSSRHCWWFIIAVYYIHSLMKKKNGYFAQHAYPERSLSKLVNPWGPYIYFEKHSTARHDFIRCSLLKGFSYSVGVGHLAGFASLRWVSSATPPYIVGKTLGSISIGKISVTFLSSINLTWERESEHHTAYKEQLSHRSKTFSADSILQICMPPEVF